VWTNLGFVWQSSGSSKNGSCSGSSGGATSLVEMEPFWKTSGNGFTYWIEVVKCLNCPSLYFSFTFFFLFFFPLLFFFSSPFLFSSSPPYPIAHLPCLVAFVRPIPASGLRLSLHPRHRLLASARATTSRPPPAPPPLPEPPPPGVRPPPLEPWRGQDGPRNGRSFAEPRGAMICGSISAVPLQRAEIPGLHPRSPVLHAIWHGSAWSRSRSSF